MKVENEMALPTTKSVAVMLLEPYAGKLARTVLRGRWCSNASPLPDIIPLAGKAGAQAPVFLCRGYAKAWLR